MKTKIIPVSNQFLFSAFLFLLSLTPRALLASDKFGDEISLKDSTPFAELATSPEKFLGKEILTKAKIEKVCQQKACWMEVSDGGKSLRVVFKDYAFFVKKDLAPNRVALQGRLQEKILSINEQRHFLKDEGKSGANIAAVKEPKKVYQFVASAVRVEK